jgi:hypothetical protein
MNTDGPQMNTDKRIYSGKEVTTDEHRWATDEYR